MGVSGAAIHRRSPAYGRLRGGRSLALFLAGFVVLALVAAQGGSAAAAPSTLPPGGTAAGDAAEGRIAFVREQLGASWYHSMLYTMKPDGSGQTRLAGPATAQEGGFAWPAWSPDGTGLAFDSAPEDLEAVPNVFVMNVDGSGRRLFAWGFHPAWSPDGTRVAFTSEDRLGDYQVYMRPVDEPGRTQLTTAGGTDPTWSPDSGDRRTGTGFGFEEKIAFSWQGHLYVLHMGSGDQTRLTRHLSDASQPHWSPDGTRIAFTRRHNGDDAIYVINANGTAPLRLAQGSQPAWSPDGTRIAFTRRNGGQPDIYAIDADGTDLTRLTRDGGAQPAWWGADEGLWANPCDEAEEGSYDDFYVDDPATVHRHTVACATLLGLVRGTTDSGGLPIYRPRAQTTRGQMASFITRSLARAGADLPDPGSDRFDDIATSAHRRNINRLARAGIVTGTGSGRFRPAAPVTRQQMASFIVRAAEYASERNLDARGNWFADVAPTSVHFANVNVGVEQLLWEGTTRPVDRARSGMYSPQRHVTRGQMATFLMYLTEWLHRNDVCANPPGWC